MLSDSRNKRILSLFKIVLTYPHHSPIYTNSFSVRLNGQFCGTEDLFRKIVHRTDDYGADNETIIPTFSFFFLFLFVYATNRSQPIFGSFRNFFFFFQSSLKSPDSQYAIIPNRIIFRWRNVSKIYIRYAIIYPS